MSQLAVLLILSGCIAYLGDRIGTKIGKKRLSIFGMRPKSTAVFVTIVTGMGITIVTIFTFALINSNVWDAIFNVPKLKKDITELTGQIVVLEGNLRTLESERGRLSEANAGLQKAIGESRKTIEDLTRSRDDLERINRENRTQIDEGLRELEKLKDESSRLRLEITRLEDELKRKSEGRVVYLKDTPILTAVLTPTPTWEGLLAQIRLALQESRDVAVERGAEAKDFDNSWDENRAAFEKLARDYFIQNTELAFGIIAAVNIYKGDKLQISIKAAPNRLILRKGESALPPELPKGLNPGADLESTEGQLIYLYRRACYELYNRGRVQNIEEVSPLELANAVEEVIRAKSGSVVDIAARDDIFAAGPCQLEFQIAPLDSLNGLRETQK